MKKVTSSNYTLYNGDSWKVLQKLIDAGVKVSSIVTDPPYSLVSIIKRFGNIDLTKDTKTNVKLNTRGDSYARLVKSKGSKTGGFLNKDWDGTSIEQKPDFWRLCFDLLPPGGFLLAFGHVSTIHRTIMAIEQSGFYIRNQIVYVNGQNFPKNKFVSKDIDKLMGVEPTVVGKREHPTLKDKSKVDRQGKQQFHGKNSIKDEWDLTEPTSPEGKKWKGFGNAIKISTELIVLAQKPIEKTIARNVLKHGVGVLNIDASRIKSKKDSSDIGRFPSNFIHDGSKPVQEMFDASGNPEAGRFFYCSKPSTAEKSAGLSPDLPNSHPTVKPIKLCEYLIRLVTPPGGTVLDPFMGSGTTGCAAVSSGYKFIGIELESEYFPIARSRIKHHNVKPDIKSIKKRSFKVRSLF